MILIKSKKEIDYIRESCRIVGNTLKLMREKAKPGISTNELDLIAEDYIRREGGRPAFKGYDPDGTNPFPATICSSCNEVVVHGFPGPDKLSDGDILSVDVGVEKDGYFGDAATTIAIGSITEEASRLMEVTRQALHIGIAKAVPGNRVSDISAAVQEYVEANGFSVVRALTGHGVGRYLHEDPAIPNYGEPGRGKRLKPGMTFAIEPMVNVGTYEVKIGHDGWTVFTADRKLSAHFEHTILITKDEPEILTKN